MAGQTVDVGGIIEIECVVFPAIASVAGSTGGPVGLDGDTKIVDDMFFACQYFVTQAQHIIMDAWNLGNVVGVRPREMVVVLHVFSRLRMTFETGLGHILPGFEVGICKKAAVVGGHRMLGQMRPGIVNLIRCCFRNCYNSKWNCKNEQGDDKAYDPVSFTMKHKLASLCGWRAFRSYSSI